MISFTKAPLLKSFIGFFNPNKIGPIAMVWAVLWTAWKFGHQTRISKELDFSWGSSKTKEWSECKIMHNAGVVEDDRDTKFYKGDYINISPFGKDFSHIHQNTNTWNYVQAIKYAEIQRKDLWGL